MSFLHVLHLEKIHRLEMIENWSNGVQSVEGALSAYKGNLGLNRDCQFVVTEGVTCKITKIL